MKKSIVLSLLLVTIFILMSKPVKVFYLPFNIPGKQMAATIPPFGVFIEDKYESEGNKIGSIVRHELVHWGQYKRMGLFNFYFEYFKQYNKNGRINNWME
jgi:hypothetical protein